MAAPTGAALKQLTAKALKSESKSAGMRTMLEAGVPVNEVAAAFDAPYGFVYGVARRANLVTSTPRTPKAATSKATTKAAAKPAAKATASKVSATKASAAKTTAKAPARASKPAPKAAAKSAKRTAARA